ncbi:MAG: DUF4381 domain-containing protein [bacterium]|nr:DUF4381 domain-containing protein [bacterium]
MKSSLFLTSVFTLSLLFSQGFSQVPSPETHSTEPVPAVVDTATIEILFPEPGLEVETIGFPQGPVEFGQPAKLNLGIFESPVPILAEEIKTSAPWLKVTSVYKESETKNFIVEFRVYRLNPFIIQLGNHKSPVIEVTGREPDLNQIAAIRMPGIWAQRWWLLVGPLFLLSCIAAAVWWLWRRRQKLESLQQWDPAPPAWLNTALEVKKLLHGDHVAGDTVRGFLDNLAVIMRVFLGQRYLVSATEMTSREILDTCRSKGHDSRELRKMVNILQDLDELRYNPQQPSVMVSQQMAMDFINLVKVVRIIPKYTSIDASLLLEAGKAWSWLMLPENSSLTPVQAGGED